ncbi:hypothetical protein [Acinetobacter radioresistens]|uniref:hypothetical protein n=1 Tax=Acinetobacter radioresistens TaxID=40216 RepID=UPI00254F064F|nr:hypothetical protein [Acinetobacter radioresistens]MDK8755933.1 hypothetical protein [Acinetobacter radioresistens]
MQINRQPHHHVDARQLIAHQRFVGLLFGCQVLSQQRPVMRQRSEATLKWRTRSNDYHFPLTAQHFQPTQHSSFELHQKSYPNHL